VRTQSTEVTDRAAAVRAAMCAVVADRGLHDASMATVARAAGVATGTAYVHYSSKEALLLATYVEVKRTLGDAAVAPVDPDAPAEERFEQLWRAAHDHLVAHSDHARFLVQIESSPLAAAAHDLAMATEGDALMAASAAPDLVEQFVDLPPAVLFDLSVGPIVRLVASGRELDADQLAALATASWRAVTR
jgi:AcrR family transcriptional regulator